MDNIHLLNKDYDLTDNISKINLDTDLVFSFPDICVEELNFDFSGVVKVLFNNPINVTKLPELHKNHENKCWTYTMGMKFSCPTGIVPIIQKHPTAKSVVSLEYSFDKETDIKIKSHKKTLKSHEACLYHNIRTEIGYNLSLFNEYDNKNLTFPSKFNIFDIIFARTIFNNTGLSNIWVIHNTEFYNNFKDTN